MWIQNKQENIIGHCASIRESQPLQDWIPICEFWCKFFCEFIKLEAPKWIGWTKPFFYELLKDIFWIEYVCMYLGYPSASRKDQPRPYCLLLTPFYTTLVAWDFRTDRPGYFRQVPPVIMGVVQAAGAFKRCWPYVQSESTDHAHVNTNITLM